MQLQLLLNNDRRSLPCARSLINEALRQLPLESRLADDLERFVMQAVDDAVGNAYPAGESGEIQLVVRESGRRLEILVRDFGLPQDVDALERQLHDPAAPRSQAPVPEGIDEVHWLSYGREGKAFQILKWLSDENIAHASGAEQLTRFEEAPPLASEQQYEIRRLRPEEAVQVSQLMYRAYGNTYFNEDVYYPARVAALNDANTVLSFVAVGESGVVAGHYALERNQPGPVAEGGQAVVDPRHRGRGLLERLKGAALEAARELDLTGWFADAVSVHTLTQKSNATHGGHLTAVDLAIAPKTEKFKNIAGELPQRVTCLLYFHWLKEPQPRRASVPDRHREMVGAIYSNLGCPVEFLDPQPPTGHGALSAQVDAGGGKAFLRVEMTGVDTVAAVAHAKRNLIERMRLEAVYVELPVADPATAGVVVELENEGFGLIGLAPHFSPRGDLLRLAYLVEPLQREPIQIFEPFAAQLVEYALAEQDRVRQRD